MASSSFFPAAQRVYANPVVKWAIRFIVAVSTFAVTTGLWPFFQGWVVTRADVTTVEKLDKRVLKIEAARTVDYERLGAANTDDTGALTESEQLQWAIIRIKRQQMSLVAETRARIGLDARMRMPNPKSDAAKRIEVSVKAKFDDLVFKGEDPTIAAQKALEYVYGPK